MHIDNWVRVGVVATVLSVIGQGWTVYRVEMPKAATQNVANGSRSKPGGGRDLTPPLWLAFIPSVLSSGMLLLTVWIAFGRKKQAQPIAELVEMPNTALAFETRRVFDTLTVGQKFVVKEIYERPGTAEPFLGGYLREMGFPARTIPESINAVLITNFVDRSSRPHARPNPDVKDIVERLLEIAALPNIQIIKQINAEVTSALQLDCKLGCDSALEELRREHARQLDVVRNELAETRNTLYDIQKPGKVRAELIQRAPRVRVEHRYDHSKQRDMLALYITEENKTATFTNIDPVEVRTQHRVVPQGAVAITGEGVKREHAFDVYRAGDDQQVPLWDALRDNPKNAVSVAKVYYSDGSNNLFSRKYTLHEEDNPASRKVIWEPGAVDLEKVASEAL